jgi:hypothetical protein
MNFKHGIALVLMVLIVALRRSRWRRPRQNRRSLWNSLLQSSSRLKSQGVLSLRDVLRLTPRKKSGAECFYV